MSTSESGGDCAPQVAVDPESPLPVTRRADRRAMIGVGAVSSGLVALIVGASVLGGGDGGDGVVGINAPDRYRIVYRLDELDDDGDVERVSVEEVLVDRPFRGRRTSWNGEDTEVEPSRISLSDFALLSVRTPSSDDFTVRTAVSPATGDLRFDDALAALVASGRLEQRGTRTVLDTSCRVFRVREPIGGGRIEPPTDTEWTDVCIDERGLMLDEEWILGGDRFQHKVAVDVEIDPPVRDRDFAPFSEPLTVASGGGAVRRVDPSSRPQFTFWELRTAPEGFTHRGRYEVSIPSGQRNPASPQEIGPPFVEIVDVYERGADFIMISRGSFLGRETQFADHGGVDVDLGDIGVGELDVGVYGTRLRIKTDAVQFVALHGTVDPDLLVELARELRPSDRGRLEYLDEPA